MFLRGQGNAQYLLNPTVLRTEPSREHRLYNDFCRRFPREVRQCENTVEKLQLMQHFGLQTRALDISENPLAALYFACAPKKKYPTLQSDGTICEQSSWGEITFFRAGQNEKGKSDDTAIKTYDSSTVSILANTARMEEKFSLKGLDILYLQDKHKNNIKDYIYLVDIVSRSVIVRTPWTNERVAVQRGTFVLINANIITHIKDKPAPVSLTETLLQDENWTANISAIKKGEFTDKAFDILKDCEADDIWFEKIKPYDRSCSIQQMRYDPFSLRHLVFKKDGTVPVALIPPYAKKKIISQLERLGITEDFVYPDMETITHEMNESIV